MEPKRLGACERGVSVGGHVLDEAVICNVSGLLDTRNSLAYFHVDPAIVLEDIKVILINELL